MNAEIQISENELEFSYARSSGPGGQNVNKVNSKALLRWNVAQSPSLTAAIRARFLSKYATRIDADGVLLVTSERFRDQPRNREDCLDKLRTMLLEVAEPPKRRRKTRPTRSSVEKRKQQKRRQGDKKRSRGRVGFSD